MSGSLPGVLFDGLSYGSLLFLISLGLSVTMGMMSFINLAHGAFAMAGGYVCSVGMERLGIPFLATLPLAFLAAAAAGALLERTLYRRFYRRSPLDQVLFSLGLTLMSVAATTWVFGPAHQPVHLPPFLLGQVRALGVDLGVYRLFLVGVVLAITVLLAAVLNGTRFGDGVGHVADDVGEEFLETERRLSVHEGARLGGVVSDTLVFLTDRRVKVFWPGANLHEAETEDRGVQA